MNKVDDILNFKRTEEEDLYAILGCNENATVRYNVYDLLYYN